MSKTHLSLAFICETLSVHLWIWFLKTHQSRRTIPTVFSSQSDNGHIAQTNHSKF